MSTAEAVAEVLVVDDDPTILAAFRRVTKDLHIRLRLARSAEEALSFLSEETPAIVISDYRLPGLDGVSFLERVREVNPFVKRILFTGEAVWRTSIGIDIPVLGKPCSPQALRALIVSLTQTNA